MSFQEDAYSTKAKLHVTQVKTPVLVGVCAAVLVVVIFIAQGLYGAFASDSFEITKAETQNTQAVSEEGEEGSANSTKSVYVHVAGAVNNPGVFTIDEGSRLFDAVEAAGGFTENAASAALNLARVVEDGEQIMVFSVQEYEAASAAAGSQGARVEASTGTINSPTGKVNINTAQQAELETLPGIGEATAKKIIAYREANGSFATIESLKDVSGIGDKKYADLADMICV